MYDLIDTIPDTISDRMLVTEAEKSAGKGASGERDAGSVSFALVHASDTEIARNNRLHTLMQVHGRWAAKQQQKKVEQMKRQNKCEGCGKEKALSMCSGELLCSSCAALAGAVSNRPDLVARMIVRREKTAAIMAAIGVGDAAVAVVESDILEKVADLLGYQPNQEAIDGDDLLGKIEALASDVGQLRAVNNEHIHFLTQLREVLGQPTAPLHDLLATVRRLETDQNQDTKDELVAAQTALDAICRAVGLTDHGELQYKHIVGAVAHLAAIIDQLMEYAGEYAACPADLLFLVKKQGDELYNMHVNLQAKQDHINLLADQVSDAEQRLLADEQVFSRIREVIGADNAANGDLPTAISALLYGGYAITTKREANHALGSRLLDLLLDFPEIGVERIAEIKEAA